MLLWLQVTISSRSTRVSYQICLKLQNHFLQATRALLYFAADFALAREVMKIVLRYKAKN